MDIVRLPRDVNGVVDAHLKDPDVHVGSRTSGHFPTFLEGVLDPLWVCL